MSTLSRSASNHAGALAASPCLKTGGWSAILVRVRAAVDRDSLDTALAWGANPTSRPELAIRAAQLVRPRHRRAVARTLRGVVAEASGPPPPVRATAVLICRKQIRATAADLLALADRVDSPRLAYATGIAIAQRLITDALASPLYVASDAGSLARLAEQAVASMDDPTEHLLGDLRPPRGPG